MAQQGAQLHVGHRFGYPIRHVPMSSTLPQQMLHTILPENREEDTIAHARLSERRAGARVFQLLGTPGAEQAGRPIAHFHRNAKPIRPAAWFVSTALAVRICLTRAWMAYTEAQLPFRQLYRKNPTSVAFPGFGAFSGRLDDPTIRRSDQCMQPVLA